MTEGERRALIEAGNQCNRMAASLWKLPYLKEDSEPAQRQRMAALVSLRAIAAALGHTVEPINKGERE